MSAPIYTHSIDELRDSVQAGLAKTHKCTWISVDGSQPGDEALHLTAHYFGSEVWCECGQVAREH